MTTAAVQGDTTPKGAVKRCPICAGVDLAFERKLEGYRLVRCRGCSFVFTDLTDEQIIEHNSGAGDTHIELYGEIQTSLDRLWFAHIASSLAKRVRQGGDVLDVGCGNGVLISELRKAGLKAQGLDPSPWAEIASKQQGFVLHKERVEADALPAQSFDGITTTSTFEHIPDPVRHVASLMRLLVAGGVLYMSGMPNYGSASVRAGVSAFHHNSPPWHANFLTPRTLRRIFDHPDVRSKVADVRIRSYGVPEAHLVYNRIFGGRRKGGHSGKAQPTNGSNIKKLALMANYRLGRPFGLGDKLEVIATRR